MANYVDEAIAARKSGYDETQGFFDRQTMRKAGQAMAQGNRAGAAGELYGAGMIDAGRTLEQEGRNIEADTRKARMEDRELANNERKQKAEFLKQAATVLRQIPNEARAEAFTGKVAPALKAMGIPDDIIAQAGQHLDDTSLQTFIGEVEKQFQVINRGGGGYDIINTRTADVVRSVKPTLKAPTGMQYGADGELEPIPGYIPTRGAIATATRAPPRASSGGRGGGGSQPAAPAPMRVSSQADYQRLPSGSVFIAPDGSVRRKP